MVTPASEIYFAAETDIILTCDVVGLDKGINEVYRYTWPAECTSCAAAVISTYLIQVNKKLLLRTYHQVLKYM